MLKSTPGTWHGSDPGTKVAWPVAVGAWVEATEPILEEAAATFGGSITYQRLGEELFERTGYRTEMLLGNWIGKVLGPVQEGTLSEGKPPLTSLVVRAETGGVGDGYINHENRHGFSSSLERQEAAAADRLTCYRVYCDDVPADAKPRMTDLFAEKHRNAAEPESPPRSCPTCHMVLPASGQCDYCA